MINKQQTKQQTKKKVKYERNGTRIHAVGAQAPVVRWVAERPRIVVGFVRIRIDAPSLQIRERGAV